VSHDLAVQAQAGAAQDAEAFHHRVDRLGVEIHEGVDRLRDAGQSQRRHREAHGLSVCAQRPHPLLRGCERHHVFYVHQGSPSRSA